MGQDVGAGLLSKPLGAAEVVEVGVGDDGGVYVAHLVAGPVEPVD